MNKIRGLAQAVGFVTLGLLALYGLLTVLGGTDAFGLAVRADAEAPNTSGQPAALMGGTIPQTMNYQGFVRNPDGSLTTGTYAITARIYVTATGGTALYTTTVHNVNVRDGLFNIVLGDEDALPPEAFADVPRYIGIDLNDGGGELIPRQRLHAVPWALTSMTLVDDATVNGLTSSSNINAANDITFGGSLNGFEFYDAEEGDSCDPNPDVLVLGSESTMFCALGQVRILDLGEGGTYGDGNCRVYRSGGNWLLYAYANCESNSGSLQVWCQAQCLTNIGR